MTSLKYLWSKFVEAKKRAHQNKEEAEDSFRSERENLHAKLADPDDEDIVWLNDAMQDQKIRMSFFWMFERDPHLNERLLAPLLEGAIREINPSLNRYFIEPAVSNFGARTVHEFLFNVIENGEPFRQAGAVNALYWAQPHLKWENIQSPDDFRNLSYENATEESRREYDTFVDLRAEKLLLLLKVFIETDNLDVQRSIIPSLSLNPKIYPEHLQESVEKAINIATNHPDKYIWHRSGVQLGTRSTLMAIPYRGTPLIPRTDTIREEPLSDDSRPTRYLWIFFIIDIIIIALLLNMFNIL
ncbi:MAG: hypothetical protein GPJ54_14720 [Candidatus Heimdallarchaeota archaeon]|nr:hypothetical protein [Candidatus Heimdallarchaeota archaeon]